MSKTLQTYPDGTEFTTTHFAIALVAGATLGTGIYLAKEKVSSFRLKRYMKKHSYTA
jgi:hypothetical protein